MAPTPDTPFKRSVKLEKDITRLIGSSTFGNSNAPLPRINAGLTRESIPPRPGADHSLSPIEASFSHIAEKLTLVWGYPNCFSYLTELIIDNRGNRKGFDLDIMSDLMLLLKITEQVAPGEWAGAPGKHR
jgi:hypothetical protein